MKDLVVDMIVFVLLIIYLFVIVVLLFVKMDVSCSGCLVVVFVFV